MKQLHIVSSLSPSYGGIATAVTGYALDLSEVGVDVTVLVTNDTYLIQPNCFKKYFLKKQPYYKKIKLIFELIKLNDIVHIHGIWSPLHNLISLFCLIIKKPYLISPHGCLSSEAFSHKYYKKLVAFIFYQKFMLNRASILFSTSKEEFNCIRSKGIEAPVAIIPLSIKITKSITRTSSHKRALFLSRIHPIKGLDNLIIAWSRISDPDWTLTIVGNDENNNASVMCGLIVSLGLSERINYIGPAYGLDKEKLFINSDLFILPSYSENFGISIAEALCYGLPVITTNRTPWSLIKEYKAGWYIQPNIDDLIEALLEAFGMTHDELKQMGCNGKKLMDENFDSKKITKMAIDSVTWILGDKTISHDFIFI